MRKQVKDFKNACLSDTSITALKILIDENIVDHTDCKNWNITQEEWKEAIEATYSELINEINVAIQLDLNDCVTNFIKNEVLKHLKSYPFDRVFLESINQELLENMNAYGDSYIELKSHETKNGASMIIEFIN